MESVEKNMVIGAFVTAGVKMGLEAWFQYQSGLGHAPINQFPYLTVGTTMLPPLDDWIASAGVPVLLYIAGKGLKKQGLVEMSKGGAIYGTSELVGLTLYRSANQLAPASASYVLANRRL